MDKHASAVCEDCATEEAAPQAEPVYATAERWAMLSQERDAVVAFLDWLDENGYALYELHTRASDGAQGYAPSMMTHTDLLYAHFAIDPAKLEADRRAMVAAFRGDAGSGV